MLTQGFWVLTPDDKDPRQEDWDFAHELESIRKLLEINKTALFAYADTLPIGNPLEDAGRLLEDVCDLISRQIARLDDGEED